MEKKPGADIIVLYLLFVDLSPKDKDIMANKNSVIYRYSCGRSDCDEEYIGESAKTFDERLKEHLKAPSPIFEHQNSSGHKHQWRTSKL